MVSNYCAELMLRVSAIIRRRNSEIAAIMVYEAGKPWDEAVGDAAEGIDFIEYYARSMMDLAQGKPKALIVKVNTINISINQLVQVLHLAVELPVCDYGCRT